MSNFSVPFSFFDFFGYLSAGFVILVSYAYSFPPAQESATTYWLGAPKGVHGLIWFLIAVTAAYVLGHLVAASGGLVLQRGSDRLVGRPAELLLRDRKEHLDLWQRVLEAFSEYYTPLDPAVRAVISDRFAVDPSTEGWERTVFSLIEARTRADDKVFGFCDRCAALYAFCRNVAVALVVAAVILGWGRGDHKQALCVGALLAAVFLGVRFLKFYRLYTMLVYTSYVSRGL